MTEEDKKLISEYMGWNPYPPECMGETVFYRDETHGDIRWDMNAAALCVQEMQKQGEDWREFHNFARNLYYTTNRSNLKIDYNFAAWLFIADNFFGAMAAWLMEEKKC